MRQQIENLVTSLPKAAVPEGLFLRIREVIQAKIRMRSMRRLMAASFSGLAVLVTGMAGFETVLSQELAQTSFFNYLKVLIMDWDLLVAHWQDVGMSLLENLPMTNIMAWLSLALLVCSLIYTIKQFRTSSRSLGGRVNA